MSEVLHQHLKHFTDPPEPPGNCCFCLETINKEAFADSCGHSFCYDCITTWSRQNAVCPLCKARFKSIIHNVRTVQIYDVCDVGLSSSEVHSDPFIPGDNNVHLPLQRTFASVVEEPQHSVPLNTPERGSFIIIPRTIVYKYNLYQADSSVSINGRLRTSSPTYYRQNPGELRRLLPWIMRDLRAIKMISGFSFNVNVVANSVIIDALHQHYIQGVYVYNALYRYLQRYTETFIEELYRFAISPFEMHVYESQIEYKPSTNISMTRMEEILTSPTVAYRDTEDLEVEVWEVFSIDDSDDDGIVDLLPVDTETITISDSEDENVGDAGPSNREIDERTRNAEFNRNKTKKFKPDLNRLIKVRNNVGYGVNRSRQRVMRGTSATQLVTESGITERASGSGAAAGRSTDSESAERANESSDDEPIITSVSGIATRSTESESVERASGFGTRADTNESSDEEPTITSNFGRPIMRLPLAPASGLASGSNASRRVSARASTGGGSRCMHTFRQPRPIPLAPAAGHASGSGAGRRVSARASTGGGSRLMRVGRRISMSSSRNESLSTANTSVTAASESGATTRLRSVRAERTSEFSVSSVSSRGRRGRPVTESRAMPTGVLPELGSRLTQFTSFVPRNASLSGSPEGLTGFEEIINVDSSADENEGIRSQDARGSVMHVNENGQTLRRSGRVFLRNNS